LSSLKDSSAARPATCVGVNTFRPLTGFSGRVVTARRGRPRFGRPRRAGVSWNQVQAPSDFQMFQAIADPGWTSVDHQVEV
jgi:hypothetical protein